MSRSIFLIVCCAAFQLSSSGCESAGLPILPADGSDAGDAGSGASTPTRHFRLEADVRGNSQGLRLIDGAILSSTTHIDGDTVSTIVTDETGTVVHGAAARSDLRLLVLRYLTLTASGTSLCELGVDDISCAALTPSVALAVNTGGAPEEVSGKRVLLRAPSGPVLLTMTTGGLMSEGRYFVEFDERPWRLPLPPTAEGPACTVNQLCQAPDDCCDSSADCIGNRCS